jgi:cytochrome c-type biogenesis protein CcmE
MSTVSATFDKNEETTTTPRRRRWPWSFVLGGLIILGAVVYLVFANTQSSAAYYMTVSELQHCTTCMARTVRVSGVVQKGTITRKDSIQQLVFTISDGTRLLTVVYNGVVPDIFNPGVQVVVEGHYSGSGPFQALTLLTKCPSKFQAATPTP